MVIGFAAFTEMIERMISFTGVEDDTAIWVIMGGVVAPEEEWHADAALHLSNISVHFLLSCLSPRLETLFSSFAEGFPVCLCTFVFAFAVADESFVAHYPPADLIPDCADCVGRLNTSVSLYVSQREVVESSDVETRAVR
jgi:hypothetical protein